MICKYCGSPLSMNRQCCDACGKPASPLVEGNEIWDMDQLLGPDSPGKQTAPVPDIQRRTPASPAAADGKKTKSERSVFFRVLPAVCAVLAIVIVVSLIQIRRNAVNRQNTGESLQKLEEPTKQPDPVLSENEEMAGHVSQSASENEDSCDQGGQTQSAAETETVPASANEEASAAEAETASAAEAPEPEQPGIWDPANNTFNNMPVETTDALTLVLNENNEYRVEGDEAGHITDYYWQCSLAGDGEHAPEDWRTVKNPAAAVCAVSPAVDLSTIRYRCIAVVNGTEAYAVYASGSPQDAHDGN